MDGIYGSYLAPNYDYNRENYDLGDPDVSYTIKVKKTRRVHTCNNCGEIIPKGVAMKKAVCIQDGKVFTYKGHIDCYV